MKRYSFFHRERRFGTREEHGYVCATLSRFERSIVRRVRVVYEDTSTRNAFESCTVSSVDAQGYSWEYREIFVCVDILLNSNVFSIRLGGRSVFDGTSNRYMCVVMVCENITLQFSRTFVVTRGDIRRPLGHVSARSQILLGRSKATML